MTTAFQPDLFQGDAFQIDGGVAGTDVVCQISITLEGCSAALVAGLPGAGGGGWIEPKRKARYVVRVKDRLIVTEREDEAIALEEMAAQPDEPAPKPAAKPAKPAKTVVRETVAIADIKALADQFRRQATVARLLREAEYQALLAVYEQLKEQEEEEELLLLL